MAAADFAECRDKHQDAKTVRERDARIMVDASDLVPRRQWALPLDTEIGFEGSPRAPIKVGRRHLARCRGTL
jgi:hypothetical protein